MTVLSKTADRASGKVPGRSAQKAMVEDVEEPEENDDEPTLEGEAADTINNTPDAAQEIISIDDDNNKMRKILTTRLQMRAPKLNWVGNSFFFVSN